MTNQNKFTQAELIGRHNFKLICEKLIPGCKIYRWSKNPMARWDVSYSIFEVMFIGEIKFRYYDSYAFTHWDLEQSKYEGLYQAKMKTPYETNLSYINIYLNNRYSIFDINDIEIKQDTVIKHYNKTTVGHNQTITPKPVYECGNELVVYNGKIN